MDLVRIADLSLCASVRRRRICKNVTAGSGFSA